MLVDTFYYRMLLKLSLRSEKDWWKRLNQEIVSHKVEGTLPRGRGLSKGLKNLVSLDEEDAEEEALHVYRDGETPECKAQSSTLVKSKPMGSVLFVFRDEPCRGSLQERKSRPLSQDLRGYAGILKEFEENLGIKIVCSREFEPMGTAGPLALARDNLIDRSGEPFFVLNSDVISEYPLKQMVEFHKTHGGEASIMVTKVDEPSKYGVVVMDEASSQVQRFVEKPQVFVGNKINAGIYLLNPEVLDRIELRPTSIEKEVFPKIAQENKLYAMVLPGFWMDVGQPRDYITGLRLYLDSLRKNHPEKLLKGAHVVGNVLVDDSAQIGEGCLIGPDVCIGQNCVIEAGVRLSRCTIMRGARVKKHACISGSIVGWHSTVGQWARVENMTVLGEDVHLGDEVYSNGGVVLPHKEIRTSILKPEIVM